MGMSAVRVRLPENSKMILSGNITVSINRRREMQLIGFSPILSTLSTMCSTNSLSRSPSRSLLNLMCSIGSIHVEAIQYNDAVSWNYDSAVKESIQFRLYSRLKDPDNSRTQAKQTTKRLRCGCLETVPTISSAGTTTCWTQGSC